MYNQTKPQPGRSDVSTFILFHLSGATERWSAFIQPLAAAGLFLSRFTPASAIRPAPAGGFFVPGVSRIKGGFSFILIPVFPLQPQHLSSRLHFAWRKYSYPDQESLSWNVSQDSLLRAGASSWRAG
jgi:hypothetical protein